MKKRHLGVLILCIVIAFVGGYVWQITHKLGVLIYSIEKISFGGEKDKYQIDAEYPQITSGISDIAKARINSELKRWATDGVEKAKSDFEGMLSDPGLTRSDLALTYVSKVAVKNDFKLLPFINISFETYTYSGGAHGITAINTFIYNANTGERINLDKVFVGDYLSWLSILSLDELKKVDPNLETYSFALDGTKPTADNFSIWTLEPDGFHIVFSDYQVGPYVVGRPEVIIPYTSLKNVLNPNLKTLLYLD